MAWLKLGRAGWGSARDGHRQEDGNDRVMPAVIHDVLARLAQRGLDATPENFTWMYRQVMRARNQPVELQYTSEHAALRHAAGAFEDLLVGDTWLAGRFFALMAVLDDAGRSEADRVGHAKAILEEIIEGRMRVLHHAAQMLLDTRDAIGNLLGEVEALTGDIGDGRARLEHGLALAADCWDLDDASALLRDMARDMGQLTAALRAGQGRLGERYRTIDAGAPYLLGAPDGERVEDESAEDENAEGPVADAAA